MLPSAASRRTRPRVVAYGSRAYDRRMTPGWIAVIVVGAVIIDVFMLALMGRGPLAWIRSKRVVKDD